MEFRIFFPIVDSISNVKEVDIFDLIGKKKGYVEERIDDYYQIKDINFGFKLRDTNRSPQVELKIRTHNFTFKEGDGIETWRKVISTPYSTKKSITDYLSGSNEAIKKCRQLVENELLAIFTVSKKRIQVIHDGCTLEQTDFTVTSKSKVNDIPILSNSLHFRSVCVEPHDASFIEKWKKDILTPYLEKVKIFINGNSKLFEENNSLISTEIKPMGYPEFLYQLYCQLTANKLKT